MERGCFSAHTFAVSKIVAQNITAVIATNTFFLQAFEYFCLRDMNALCHIDKVIVVPANKFN